MSGFTYGGKGLPCEAKPKMLGVRFDEELMFDSHAEAVIGRHRPSSCPQLGHLRDRVAFPHCFSLSFLIKDAPWRIALGPLGGLSSKGRP